MNKGGDIDMNMKMLHMVAFVLAMIGAINWGLTALGFNLVNMILGGMPGLEMVVYLLVGASGVYILLTHKADCKICSKK
jgi:uncharacterized membrane protein YuzA (DUF378 family)